LTARSIAASAAMRAVGGSGLRAMSYQLLTRSEDRDGPLPQGCPPPSADS
jgi:hypothetical protein